MSTTKNMIKSITFLHVSKSQYFFSNLNSYRSNLFEIRNIQEQVKKHSVTKNCPDLSMFE